MPLILVYAAQTKTLLMSYRLLVVLSCLLLLSPSQAQQDSSVIIRPDAVISGTSATLELYFTNLRQGRVGLLRLVGPYRDAVVEASFLGQSVRFFQRRGYEGHFALLAAPIDQTPRVYDLTVSWGGENLVAPVNIVNGGFIQQDVIVVGRANELLNREIEEAELAHLFELAAPFTERALWGSRGFMPPLSAPLTSPFGAQRLFNGLYETIHTGWDYQATLGLPMGAIASGRVVFAGPLDIRGNYVLIDHGLGVYSGLAHLSVIHVIEGQEVIGGQIIGQVGNTGRSSSAHAHLEMIVNGQWVDSADFLALPLPR
ncbi:MAG: M23 family metallopeptidase [Anaerolineae bacterium]|nr:M23 family metallopeptidase [Anaerolineae bacterium]